MLLGEHCDHIGSDLVGHIAVGRAHKRKRVTLLVADADVRVLADDGTLLRQLTLDPGRVYQPLGQPRFVADVVRQVSTMS